jgi:hypothetical protein
MTRHSVERTGASRSGHSQITGMLWADILLRRFAGLEPGGIG